MNRVATIGEKAVQLQGGIGVGFGSLSGALTVTANAPGGGGGNYRVVGLEVDSAGVTNFACASANLTVSKTNAATKLVCGQTTAYSETAANLGPGDAPGTLVRDPVSLGLTITDFPVHSSLNFLVACVVTATRH